MSEDFFLCSPFRHLRSRTASRRVFLVSATGKTRAADVRSLEMTSGSTTAMSKHLQPERKEAPGPSFEPGAKPFTNGSGRVGEQRKKERRGILYAA